MKKYQIIYADPPWSYYNDSNAKTDCTTIKGMRRPPYKVMSSENIAKLQVNKIADKNCILFIWTTDYHLNKCLEVIKAWGFEYKTIGFVWAKKTKQGEPVCFMGAYTMKSGVELCLLATKGKDAHKLVKRHNVRALVESQRQIHSKKPDEVRNRIVKLVGDIPRIELFARKENTLLEDSSFKNWDLWGNEVKSNIKL